MNYAKLLKEKERISAGNDYTLTTKELKELLTEAKKEGIETTISDKFFIQINDINIVLDFENQKHLLLPF